MSGEWIVSGKQQSYRLDPKRHSAAFTVMERCLVLVTMVFRVSSTTRTGKPQARDHFESTQVA